MIAAAPTSIKNFLKATDIADAMGGVRRLPKAPLTIDELMGNMMDEDTLRIHAESRVDSLRGLGGKKQS